MSLLNKPYRILVIDDDDEDYFLISDYLHQAGNGLYQVEWAPTFKKGEEVMAESRHDLYLIDHLLGTGTGLELIRLAAENGCRSPKILLTGIGNRDLDMQAIRAGADDYLPKTMLNHEILERTIRHALERFEQRLMYEEQQARFKTLFEQSNDPIYVTDRNWQILDFNRSLLKLFALKPEEIVQKKLEDLFVSHAMFDQFKEQVEAEGFVLNFTGDFLVKDNPEHLIALISSSPVFDHQRKITGFQGMIHDITRLKKAEKEILLAEQINMTGRMAGIIAHEVRNPLTNINLAVDQLEESLTAEQDDLVLFTEIIKRSSERINNLISDFLNSTRLAQPELILYPVEDVLRNVLLVCDDRIRLKGVTVHRNGLEGSTPVRIDPEKLKMAFVNMVTNAIEAMEDTQNPELHMSLGIHPSHILVTISDNGKGMDEHTRKHLFEAFFTGRKGGIGLGMTAVQNIILQHNGRIEVSSEPGKGTTFRVYIRS